MNSLKIILCLGLCAFFCTVGYAQSSSINGGLEVTVREAGTPLAGATVTVTNTETGLARSCITLANGECVLPFLPPGTYRIVAEAAQAADYEMMPDPDLSNYGIPHGQTTILRPPPIELRKKTPTTPTPPPSVPVQPTAVPTNVVAGGPQINLDNGARSAYFGERALLSLPLFSARSFDQLALLAAGVAPPPQAIGENVGPGLGAGVGTSGQFAVSGLRSRANNFTVDGSDNNDDDVGVRRQGFTALVPQAVESLQGFRIVTLLPLPQYGRNLGAQVDAVSRGGSQAFHGTLYGFFTDRKLKARDFFDQTNARNVTLQRFDGKPVLLSVDGAFETTPIRLPNLVERETPYTRGQYGFVVGGPINPKRTFFLASFERQDVNAMKEAHFAVPTVRERGLFNSGETGLTARTTTGNVPVFPTTVYGDSYLSLFPFANNPDGPYGANTFTQQLPLSADGTIFSVKLQDSFKAFGREHLVTGRYNFTDDAATLPVTGEALFSSLRSRVRTQNLALSLVSTLSAQLSNEARFSYGRTRLGFAEPPNIRGYLRDEIGRPFLRASRALPNVPFLLNARRVSNATALSTDFPDTAYILRRAETADSERDTDPVGQVFVSGFSPIGVDAFNFPQRRVNNTFQYADTLVYSPARHRLTLGADVRRLQLNSAVDRNFRPVARFSGSLDVAGLFNLSNRLQTDGFFRGTDFVALGGATGFSQTQATVNDSTIGLRQWQTNFFAVDQFKLKPNLQLTLGLRYELNTVPREVADRIEASFTDTLTTGFIADEKSRYQQSGLEQFLAGRDGIYRSDRNNVAPHIALAWDPRRDGRTVIRAGYGLYYDQILGSITSQSRNVFPRFLTLNLAGITESGVIVPFNPARLSQSGTLNLLNRNFAPDLLAALRKINQAANPSPNYFPATPNFVLPEAALPTPYAQHWGVTVEHETRQNLLISLAYTGTKGTHLLRFATPNLGPNSVLVVDGASLSGNQIDLRGFAVSPGTALNFRRPHPLLGSITAISADANSSYHSLQATAALRLSRLQMNAAYTWSHALDEVSDIFALAGAPNLPQDSFNRSGERGNANFDLRHRFTEYFIWELPLWERSKIWGGWQLAGIATVQTGQPFTINSSLDVNLDGNLTDRLNSLAGVSEVNDGTRRYIFPTSQLEQFRLLARAGAHGAVGRNTFHAPGTAVLDLAINKHFRFGERHDLEWRTEVFNLFNRRHFGIPVRELLMPSVGRAVRTSVPARTIQFAVRYKF